MFTFPVTHFGGGDVFEFIGDIMAFGPNGYTAYSDDAQTWTVNDPPEGEYSGSFVSDEVLGARGTRFLCNDGAGTMYCMREAADGTTGEYDLLSSTDGGATWSTVNANFADSPGSLIYAGNKLFAYTQGQLRYSTNGGTSFSTATNNGRSFAIVSDIVKTDTDYIAVGFEFDTGFDAWIWVSSDGITWANPTTFTADGDGSQLHSVAYDSTGGVAVACGSDGQVYSSSDDGDTWTSRTLGSSSTQDAVSVAWSGSEFAIVTGMGTGVNAAEVHRSTDGATWTRTYTESFADFGDIAWCATDSQFIIVGPQETSPYIYIKTSPDCTASSFTNRTAASGESAAPNFINVTYDNSTDEYCIAASGVSGGGGD